MARPKRWRPVPQRIIESDAWHTVGYDSKLVYLMLYSFVCDGHGWFPSKPHEIIPKLMLDPDVTLESLANLKKAKLIQAVKSGGYCLVSYEDDLPSYYLSKVPKKTHVYISKDKENNKNSKGNDFIDFDSFWDEFKPRVNKAEAKKAWKKLNASDRKVALDGVKRYAQSGKFKECMRTKIWQYMPHPATWLNQRRWEDEDLKAVVPDHHKPTGEEVVFLD
tara:strand:- start:2274 stop:2933 length:660 start_codon:yes stop_codon:yes gene_type:complete